MRKTEAKTLAELNLMADKVGCIWLKDVHVQDYLPPVEVLLEILQWLSRLRIENLLTYALHCYISSFLWASICSRFPYEQDIVDEWFTYSPDG